jgi:hypothetical protein
MFLPEVVGMLVVVVGAVMWMVVRAVGIRTVGMIQLAMVCTVHLTTRTVFVMVLLFRFLQYVQIEQGLYRFYCRS